jgi:uncharacterized protein YjbI with pentapeptide repeats
MANREHREILQQGVNRWNEWRVNQNVFPDLSATDLRGADLSRANLKDAYLIGAWCKPQAGESHGCVPARGGPQRGRPKRGGFHTSGFRSHKS